MYKYIYLLIQYYYSYILLPQFPRVMSLVQPNFSTHAFKPMGLVTTIIILCYSIIIIGTMSNYVIRMKTRISINQCTYRYSYIIIYLKYIMRLIVSMTISQTCVLILIISYSFFFLLLHSFFLFSYNSCVHYIRIFMKFYSYDYRIFDLKINT